jgi:hypothetical protein
MAQPSGHRRVWRRVDRAGAVGGWRWAAGGWRPGCRMSPGSQIRRSGREPGWPDVAGESDPAVRTRLGWPDAAGKSRPAVQTAPRPAGSRREVRSGGSDGGLAGPMPPGGHVRRCGTGVWLAGCRREVRSGGADVGLAGRMSPGSQIRPYGRGLGWPDAAGKSRPAVRTCARLAGCRREVRSGGTDGGRPARCRRGVTSGGSTLAWPAGCRRGVRSGVRRWPGRPDAAEKSRPAVRRRPCRPDPVGSQIRPCGRRPVGDVGGGV